MKIRLVVVVAAALTLCGLASAQIDNCCFVDRQCGSDQEWTNGYWAFQNGQCAAPAPSGQPANSSAPVDNCCGIDRQCSSNQEWTNGYWAFQNNECGGPSQSQTQPSQSASSRPPIEGSSRFHRHITATLNWVERRAPEWYAYIISGADRIFEISGTNANLLGDAYTDQCTAFAYSRERKIGLETCHLNVFQRSGFSAWYDRLNSAGTLAHEACHIHRHEAGFVYDSSTRAHEELECGKPKVGVNVALDPYGRYGALSYLGEPAFSVVERFCSEGFHPELYCPAIERVRGS